MIGVKTTLETGVFLLTVLMMGIVGAELEVRQFRELARNWAVLVRTLVAQAVILPLLGFVLARLLALPPHLSAGLLLVAACPVGEMANLFTLLARANVALSVAANTLTCALSVVTMAVTFQCYTWFLGTPFLFRVPALTLVARLTLLVALPVLAGMGLRQFRPDFVQRRMKDLRKICLAGVAVLLAYVAVSQREHLAVDWGRTAAAAALFMVLAISSGLLLGWALRLVPRDVFTVATVFAVRNVALAMGIAVTLFQRVEYAVFATVYFLTETLLLLAMVAVYRLEFGSVPRLASRTAERTQ